jgi:predicted Zn-dependent protease
MNGNGTIGYYDDRDIVPAILIVSDRLDDKDEYRAVVMHELGHALDLQHMNGADGIGALMSPSMSTGSFHITDKDVAQYCKIHHCKDF